MWAFLKGAKATGDGHLQINNCLPENPLPEVASAVKDKFWISQIRYGWFGDLGKRGGKNKISSLACERVIY